MELIIAEKPQVAAAIAEAIGESIKKEKGYIITNDYYITWCIGHLLEIKLPDEQKKWSFDTLPVLSDGWSFQVNERTKEQYNIVTDLLTKADTIIHAGDPDDEGQLIVDSILYTNGIIDLQGSQTKEVKRLLINDFNTEVIKKELSKLKDNNDYISLSLKAIARKLADMVFGYNLTRAYTLMNNALGNDNVISVGRVQTPMLALIVRRDAEVKNHVKSYYYEIRGLWKEIDGNTGFIFTYKPKKEEIDDTKKIVSEITAATIVQRLNDNRDKAVLTKYAQKEEIENVPLPYNLLDLQADCSKLYKMKPDKVMSVTQSLREKHKAITYNRSDCNYLHDETYTEAPEIINILEIFTDDILSNIIDNADMSIKSRAFNSSKTTAHTAIIPTKSTVDFSAFSEDEKKVYLLIARRFAMQFLPPARYIRHNMTIQVGEDILENTHRQLVDAGWKKVLSEKENDEVVIHSLDYTILNENKKVEKIDFAFVKNETKPKKLYTIDTFLNDLKRVSIYCKDEKIKALLKDKDKDKAGESGGIGTPATRSEIIKTLYERNYIKDEKNYLVSTELGRELISSLQDTITYPDMTALWHEQLKDMDSTIESVYDFVKSVTDFSINEINAVKTKELKFKNNSVKCPVCDGFLKRIKWNGSFFWSCSNYPDCKVNFKDNNGKPDIWHAQDCKLCNSKESVKKTYNKQGGAFWKCESCNQIFSNGKNELPEFEKQKATPSDKYKCLECNSPLIIREGKYGKFWACSAYPKCKTIYKDNSGEPLYNK